MRPFFFMIVVFYRRVEYNTSKLHIMGTGIRKAGGIYKDLEIKIQK